jgi:hypothetical protein
MNRDEQVAKNLELAERYLHGLLDHPAELEKERDPQSIVLIPADDPELATANSEMARRVLLRCGSCGAPLPVRERCPDEQKTDDLVLHAVCP